MSWIRIAKYALVLFAATAIAAFPVGFARGFVGAATPVPGLLEVLRRRGLRRFVRLPDAAAGSRVAPPCGSCREVR